MGFAPASIRQKPSVLFLFGLGLSAAMALSALVLTQGIVRGYMDVLTDPAILLTDFSYVGGIGAAFLNAGLMGLLASLLVYASGDYSGISFAAVMMCAGFAFFGKTPVTGIIIIGGTIIRNFVMQKRPFDSIITALFGTCMGPMVSYIAYSTPGGWPLAALAGLAAGFLLPEAAAITKRAYRNLNLYNTAFASTMITAVAAEVIRGLGFPLDACAGPTVSYPSWAYAALASFFALAGLAGLMKGKDALDGLKRIAACRCEGADYLSTGGLGGALLNFSLVGFILVFVPWLVLRAPLTGPLFGTIIAVSGWASSAKKPSAMATLIAGYVIAFYISSYELTPAIAMGALFVTGLCPLSDRLGPLYGVLAGFIHLFVVTKCSSLHGGLMLYNNGLSAGIVAIVVLALYRTLQPAKSKEL